MTTYYVGSGGNDSNDGLSWANRFLTLNGAEDEPVAANDTVYVGPGVYRELLTVDVSGSSGQPITYIGDVTGENTDGVGGIVRITGSDDDQTASRARCISSTTYSYRTFRGFAFDFGSTNQVQTSTSCDNWIIEDCFFGTNPDDGDMGIRLAPASGNLFTIRRCIFTDPGYSIYIDGASDLSVSASSLIENCLFIGTGATAGAGVVSNNVAGFVVKNCTFKGRYYGTRTVGLGASTNIDVYNSIFEACRYALHASASGEIVEDYNSAPISSTTPRTNVTPGANSNTYPALFEMPIILDQYGLYAWKFGELSKWSELARIAGSSEASDDLYGMDRPATSAKKSWGAVQYKEATRETTTTRGSSDASIKFADAGRHQMFVPHDGTSTTIAVYVNREANYAGTNPQLIVKQPGAADDTTTDAAAVSQWNELTTTLTPNADPPYVVVELVSNNTATSGSYAVYFDDLSVT